MISSDTVKRGEGTTSMKIAFPVVLERTWKNLWRKKDVSPSFLMPADNRHSLIDCYNPLSLVGCLFFSFSASAGVPLVCLSVAKVSQADSQVHKTELVLPSNRLPPYLLSAY